MKKITKILAAVCLSFSLVTSANAQTVVCANCSEMITQLLGYIQDAAQLKTVIDQYAEAITQTEQQIRMVAQNVEQYENMLKNTKQLSSGILSQMRGDFTRLANLHGRLQTYRGDISSMGQIFGQVYPELDFLEDLAATSGDAVGPANQKYNAYWRDWSDKLNTAQQETFKLTGEQLKELSNDELEAHVGQLLSTPEGQMEAAMAGNKLTSLHIQETRALRGLMATSIQSQVQKDMKAEKKEEMSEELKVKLRDAKEFKDLSAINAQELP